MMKNLEAVMIDKSVFSGHIEQMFFYQVYVYFNRRFTWTDRFGVTI